MPINRRNRLFMEKYRHGVRIRPDFQLVISFAVLEKAQARLREMLKYLRKCYAHRATIEQAATQADIELRVSCRTASKKHTQSLQQLPATTSFACPIWPTSVSMITRQHKLIQSRCAAFIR